MRFLVDSPIKTLDSDPGNREIHGEGGLTLECIYWDWASADVDTVESMPRCTRGI